ncbi:hypothetical protein OSTOST_19900, partial [Ostertagia ostertagi]
MIKTTRSLLMGRSCHKRVTFACVVCPIPRKKATFVISSRQSQWPTPSGECYCELPSKKDALKALDLHRKEMEGRYIEVFTVSNDELTNLKRVGIVSDDGTVIRLRGLPFSASTQDVRTFSK